MEEFFQFFFSDQAVDFQDSFHRKCGDKGNWGVDVEYLYIYFLINFQVNSSVILMFFFSLLSKYVSGCFLLFIASLLTFFQILSALNGILMKNLGTLAMCHFNIQLSFILVIMCVEIILGVCSFLQISGLI